MEVHRAILQKNRNSFNCELKNYAEKHDKSDVNTELALINQGKQIRRKREHALD